MNMSAPAPSRVLVVDDDTLLNALFESFLVSKGMGVIVAYSLKDAIAVLSEDAHVDLVLLDHQLGDGFGMDLLSPDMWITYKSTPPVIMVSSNEDPIFLEECFERGVSDYVIKPVNLSLLSLKVRSLLSSVEMHNLITTQKHALENFKREAQREEAVAKFIYEYVLRQNNNDISGVTTWLSSCSSFSGDMTLAKFSPNGSLYFMLADATGHGLSAAITIMPVISIFNSMVSKGFQLQQIVTEINKKVLHDSPADRFVAAIVIELHKEKGEISVWNGGMPTAYWHTDGVVVHEFRSKNMALGILDDNVFDATLDIFPFEETGELFLCSDGLLEQRNADGEPFSMERVISLIGGKSNSLHDSLISSLEIHAGIEGYDDDVSICSLDFSKIFKIKECNGVESSNSYKILTNAAPFSWSMSLTGKNIAECEIPTLSNSYLRSMGFSSIACQKIFLIISEVVSNAIDHGVLKLDSSLKNEAEGFMAYISERESRLKKLTDNDEIEFNLTWFTDNNDPRLLIAMRDSGSGYMSSDITCNKEESLSGRGLGLIKKLSSSVEVVSPGNLINVVLR